MSVLRQVFKLEEKYLLIKTKPKSPPSVIFILEHSFMYLKSRIADLESSNKIPNSAYNEILYNYVHEVERFVFFHDIKKITNKELYLILLGVIKLLKIYVEGVQTIDEGKKKRITKKRKTLRGKNV